MAVSSWRKRKAVMCERGAERSGVVMWRRKRGRRDSRREMREGGRLMVDVKRACMRVLGSKAACCRKAVRACRTIIMVVVTETLNSEEVRCGGLWTLRLHVGLRCRRI